MATAHPFTPRPDDNTRCAHRLSTGHGYAGGTCGFPAENRQVHAPGAVAKPERRLVVARQDTAAPVSA